MTRSDEFDFANSARAALEDRAPRGAWILVGTMLALVAIGLLWARWATLQEVTTASGRVISSSQLQVVQTLEAGIVREIFVHEGDTVKKGQVLMQIDDTGFASKLGELRERKFALMAQVARLRAEARGLDGLDADKVLAKNAPQALAAERAGFLARKLKRAQEEEILKQQVFQKRQEATELEARAQKLQATLSPMQKELELTRKLAKRGVVPEIDMLRLERQYAEISGELKVIQAGLPRARSAIEEARTRLVNARSAFKAEAQVLLAKTAADLAIANQALRAARDRVNRASLRSPANGVVNKINVTTIGAVVQPGFNVLTIVPTGDRLLIEAHVRPRDVAFIKTNQKASVKLTAYDYLIFGALSGKVKLIGADTISDPNLGAYYRVVVETDNAHVSRNGKKYPIIPGMVASVDILTGQKTVLDYILKPINRARREALRER